MNKIQVLRVDPMKYPEFVEIDNSLESLQTQVDGYIEAIYPFDDAVGIICNDEGKINGMPLNRALYDDHGQIIDIISGNFLIVGLGKDDFVSLDEKHREKYMQMFYAPQIFVMKNEKIEVIELKSVKSLERVERNFAEYEPDI